MRHETSEDFIRRGGQVERLPMGQCRDWDASAHQALTGARPRHATRAEQIRQDTRAHMKAGLTGPLDKARHYLNERPHFKKYPESMLSQALEDKFKLKPDMAVRVIRQWRPATP